MAGGCWASADKGLAAWPRLIRSQADPGGNQRAGISKIGLSPRPGQWAGLSVTPQGFTFRLLSHWKDPGPLRTSPSAQLHTEGKLRQESSGLLCWLDLACGFEHPSCVRACWGWGALSGPAGARDWGPPSSSLLPLPGSSFYRAPPSLSPTPTLEGGMAEGSSDTPILGVLPGWLSRSPLCYHSTFQGDRKGYSWGRFPILLEPSNRCPSKSPQS